jgi:hypothetical protein
MIELLDASIRGLTVEQVLGEEKSLNVSRSMREAGSARW